MASRDVVLAAKGGGVVFAGRLFTWGTRLLIAVMLARLLGADNYGLYSIAVTVATLGSAFSVIGLDSALVRYVAVFSRRGDRRSLLGTLQSGIGLPMLAGGLAAAVLLVLAGFIARDLIGDPRMEPLLRVVALLVPAMVANSLLAATLQGAQRIAWAVVAEQFAQPIVRLAVLLGFALVGLTAELAVLALTLATLVVTALLLVFVHREVSLSGIRSGAKRDTRTMVRFSLPVYFSNIVNTFGNNLQTLLLGSIASVASAGIFAVANQVMLIGTIFHSAIVQSAMPIFAELQDAEDSAGLRHLYRTTSKWTLTLNLPFFLMAFLFPRALLGIFGPEFQDAAPALAVLATASLVNAGTGTSGAVLDMTGHTRVKLLNSTVSVALAIGLNLLLIPPLGVMGAAIAAFGAIASVNLLRVLQVHFLVHVGPYDRSWAKPLVAGAIAAAAGGIAAALVAGLGIFVQAAIGIALLMGTYAATLLLLGLDEDDRLILSRAVNRVMRRRKKPGSTSAMDGTRSAEGRTS